MDVSINDVMKKIGITKGGSGTNSGNASGMGMGMGMDGVMPTTMGGCASGCDMTGGKKMAKRASKKKASGGRKTKSSKSCKDGTVKKWIRTLSKHRSNDGTVRTIWKNVQTGSHAIRRIRVINGSRKAVYTKI